MDGNERKALESALFGGEVPFVSSECMAWVQRVARRVATEIERLTDDLDKATDLIERLREVIIVRDPDSGGWECMSCNRVAAYNAREDLEHETSCALYCS